MNQLKPNTYTICESTEQCKELFDLSDKEPAIDAGGSFYAQGEDMLYMDKDGLIVPCKYSDYQKGIQKLTFIPLPEFIARLKGE